MVAHVRLGINVGCEFWRVNTQVMALIQVHEMGPGTGTGGGRWELGMAMDIEVGFIYLWFYCITLR